MTGVDAGRQLRTVYVSHPASGLGRSNYPVVCEVAGNEIVRCLPFYIPDDVRLYEIPTPFGTFTRPRKDVQMPLAYLWKRRIRSSDRLTHPLLRRCWSHASPNSAGRGSDDYVQITWDDALEIIANKLADIRERYGNMESVLVQADGHGQSGYLHSLHFWGHFLFDKMRERLGTGWWTQLIRNPDSWEGYYWGAKHVWGFNETLGEPYQDAVWDDVLNYAEVVIFSGNDPEATGLGMSGSAGVFMPKWLKSAGKKIIAISPDLNYGAAVLADTWIPIRPNTDAALYLAISYVWIIEDTYAHEYVETRTVGFDEYRKHVLGDDDGIPKTPEWAAAITGVPPYLIRALAREWATKRTSLAVYFGGPKVRGTYSHVAGRLEAYVLAMQGIGLPGRQFLRTGAPSFYRKWLAQVPRYPGVDHHGIAMTPLLEYAIGKGPMSPSFVPRTLASDAILHPPVEWNGNAAALSSSLDQFESYRFPPNDEHPGVRVIWNENGSQAGSWGHGAAWLQALREPSVEFVVGIHPWMEGDIGYSDLILPAQTVFEHPDIMSVSRSDVIAMIYQEQAIDPVGESKSDYEIHRLIAERLGIGDAFPEPEQILAEAYSTTYAAREAGIAWAEFKKRRVVVYDCPTPEEWREIKEQNDFDPDHGGLHWYATRGSGLQTDSGKIEFVSGAISRLAPDSVERPPLARWLGSDEVGQLGDRAMPPLRALTNHPRFRFHVQGDNIPQLREIAKIEVDGYQYEPMWISSSDAAARGIANHDVVLMENARGRILVGARVTERIVQGAVLVEHGAAMDLAELGGEIVDRGGNVNFIAPLPREKYKDNERLEVPEMNVSGFLVSCRPLTPSERSELRDLGSRGRGFDHQSVSRAAGGGDLQ